MKLRNKKTGVIINVCIIVNHKEYRSIGELYDDYEDYKPAEPIIKDEKIRKAVSAWAEANGIKEIIIFDHSNNTPYTPVGAVDFAQNSGHLEIRFRTEERFDTDRIYTIDELCGEEE